MRRNIDRVEIKNPPIEEITKKRSCFKLSCSSSCGCLILVIIVAIIFLHATVGEKTRELKYVPSAITQQVVLYDDESINKIEYTPYDRRSSLLSLFGYIPRLLIAPLELYLNPPESADQSTTDRFIEYMSEPVSLERDHVLIEWMDLSAEPHFIIDFYKTELRKKGFIIDSVSKNNIIEQFIFSKRTMSGAVYVEDNPRTRATDIVRVTIESAIDL